VYIVVLNGQYTSHTITSATCRLLFSANARHHFQTNTNNYLIFEGLREVYNKITAFWDGRDSVQSGRYATPFRRNLLLPSSGQQRYYVPPKHVHI